MVVVDSIVAALLAPWARAVDTPMAAMLHQVPGGIDHAPLRGRVQARLDEQTYRHCRLLMVASDTLSDDLKEHGYPPVRIHVVAPGRDPARASGPPPGPPRRTARAFLCVANWIPRKGILDALDALARLPVDAATLHLVGDDRADRRYADRVRARLRDPALADRVVVHGPRPAGEVAAMYVAADVFVLPSTKEPYGTVLGEALAAGLPLVGWEAGNLPHLVADGHEGVVVPVGDLDGLAATLARLAEDDNYRGALAQAARRRGEALPTWDDTARRVLRLVAGGLCLVIGRRHLVEREQHRPAVSDRNTRHGGVAHEHPPRDVVVDGKGPCDGRLDRRYVTHDDDVALGGLGAELAARGPGRDVRVQ